MFKFLTGFEKFWTLIIEFIICLLFNKREEISKATLWPHNARTLAHQIAHYIAVIL